MRDHSGLPVRHHLPYYHITTWWSTAYLLLLQEYCPAACYAPYFCRVAFFRPTFTAFGVLSCCQANADTIHYLFAVNFCHIPYTLPVVVAFLLLLSDQTGGYKPRPCRHRVIILLLLFVRTPTHVPSCYYRTDDIALLLLYAAACLLYRFLLPHCYCCHAGRGDAIVWWSATCTRW